MMAGLTGLEPATSCVTGRRSNQLNYNPAEREVTCPSQPKVVEDSGAARPCQNEHGAERGAERLRCHLERERPRVPSAWRQYSFRTSVPV